MLRWLSAPALLRIEAPAAQAAQGVPAWGAGVAAAAALLPDLALRSARARFVVSDHLVRYLVLPWDASLGARAERERYLRHHFESVYGPRAAHWHFAVDRDGGESTRVAAAIDGGLAEALKDAARRNGMRVESVEPLAVAAYNRLLRGTPADADCFFVMREPGRLTALFVRGGAVQRVASQRCAPAAGRGELAALLAAEAVDAGLARDAAAAVYCASWPGAAPELAGLHTLAELLAPGVAAGAPL